MIGSSLPFTVLPTQYHILWCTFSTHFSLYGSSRCFLAWKNKDPNNGLSRINLFSWRHPEWVSQKLFQWYSRAQCVDWLPLLKASHSHMKVPSAQRSAANSSNSLCWLRRKNSFLELQYASAHVLWPKLNHMNTSRPVENRRERVMQLA